MKNEEVIKMFANGYKKAVQANSVSISAKGNVLYSYGTAIAQRLRNGKFIVNETKYSVTTSKAQSYVRYHIPNELQKIAKNVPMWAHDLKKYVVK